MFGFIVKEGCHGGLHVTPLRANISRPVWWKNMFYYLGLRFGLLSDLEAAAATAADTAAATAEEPPSVAWRIFWMENLRKELTVPWRSGDKGTLVGEKLLDPVWTS